MEEPAKVVSIIKFGDRGKRLGVNGIKACINSVPGFFRGYQLANLLGIFSQVEVNVSCP
jgi:hypothetical protein